jgi:hypothetical protein
MSVDDRVSRAAHDGGTAGECGQRETASRAGLRSATFVVVMQTADVWNGDDRAAGWRLDNMRHGRILVQREVSAPVVVMVDIAVQVALQRALVQHDDVIEALASKGADQAPADTRAARSRLFPDRATCLVLLHVVLSM